MEMHAIVGSGRIAKYGYDSTLELLALEFVGGARWLYGGVPVGVFEDFLLADSRGAFFERMIRPVYQGRAADRFD